MTMFYYKDFPVPKAETKRGWAQSWREGDIYPLTIIPARYGGVYEDGEWLALPFEFTDIPEDIIGDDMACSDWFSTNSDVPIGRGDSPKTAVDDLFARLAPYKSEGKNVWTT